MVQPLLLASTQYEVVVLMIGVVKLVPVPSTEPPVAALCQLMVPPLEVACKVVIPVPHITPWVTLCIVGVEETTTVTANRVADSQPFKVWLA